MNRDLVLSVIHDIQSIFPPEFINRMSFTPVASSNLAELLARSLVTFPPVFLPVFERDGDLYAVHLKMKTLWQECAWVRLDHDSATPALVATCLRYLPVGLLMPPHINPGRVDEVWDFFKMFADCIPDAIMPEQTPFKDSESDWTLLKAQYDKLDGAARLAAATQFEVSAKQVKEPVEAILQELPDDTFTLAVAAIVRFKIGYADSFTPALQVLSREVAYGFNYATGWLAADSGPDLLELVRPIALTGIEERNPLIFLKNSSFKEAKTAAVLSEIAIKFRDLGDEEQALNQLRNGAAVAGVYGRGLNLTWCKELGQQADRVEANCVAAALANLAAEVIHMGP